MQLTYNQLVRHVVRVDRAIAAMLASGRADGQTWEEYDDQYTRLADLQHKLFCAAVDALDC